MTVVHTYFYIVINTQRGCHSLKINKSYILQVNALKPNDLNIFVHNWIKSYQNRILSIEYFSEFSASFTVKKI